MNLLCWNCRGIGNPLTVRQLRRWSTKFAADMAFISETKINRIVVEALKGRLGFSNAFGVSSRGTAGGMCLYWRDGVNFALKSFSQNHICGDVTSAGKGTWRFVGIYGWPETENKYKTWDLIKNLCEDTDIPILLGGDFNEILCYEKKEGGADNMRREMMQFRAAIDECELQNLGFEGQWYTWERGNSPATRVRERLDLFLVSSVWKSLFPYAYVEHLVRYKSDHTAIIVRHKKRNPRKKRRKNDFKFETCWLLDETCEQVVKGSWETTTGDDVTDRILAVAHELMGWSRIKYDDLGKQIEDTEKALRKAQQKPISDASCEECVRLEKVLDDLNSKHEAYWYLRSRVAEIRDGDKNTKYFHHKASQRKKRNNIEGLYDANGEWQVKDEKIEDIVVSYYENLFSTSDPSDVNFSQVIQHACEASSYPTK